MEETRPLEHQRRTLALADRLRAGGVDAEIDQDRQKIANALAEAVADAAQPQADKDEIGGALARVMLDQNNASGGGIGELVRRLLQLFDSRPRPGRAGRARSQRTRHPRLS